MGENPGVGGELGESWVGYRLEVEEGELRGCWQSIDLKKDILEEEIQR